MSSPPVFSIQLFHKLPASQFSRELERCNTGAREQKGLLVLQGGFHSQPAHQPLERQQPAACQKLPWAQQQPVQQKQQQQWEPPEQPAEPPRRQDGGAPRPPPALLHRPLFFLSEIPEPFNPRKFADTTSWSSEPWTQLLCLAFPAKAAAQEI